MPYFISYNSKVQDKRGSASGFLRLDISEKPIDEDKIQTLACIATKSDWSPYEFIGGERLAKTSKSVSFLVFDVDEGKTIEEFCSEFTEYKYIIFTSRNHQKEKKIGKTGEKSPPCDRYHVLFPLPSECHDMKRIKNINSWIIKKYPFFDTQVKDIARFYFANPDLKWLCNDGEKFIFTENESYENDLTDVLDKAAVNYELIWQGNKRNLDFDINNQEHRAVLKDLLVKKKIDFDDRDRWVTLAHAMSNAGFNEKDFIDCSYNDTDCQVKEAQRVWRTLPKTEAVGVGTLMFYSGFYDGIRDKVDKNKFDFEGEMESLNNLNKEKMLSFVKSKKDFDDVNFGNILSFSKENVAKYKLEIGNVKQESDKQKLISSNEQAIIYIIEHDPIVKQSLLYDEFSGKITYPGDIFDEETYLSELWKYTVKIYDISIIKVKRQVFLSLLKQRTVNTAKVYVKDLLDKKESNLDKYIKELCSRILFENEQNLPHYEQAFRKFFLQYAARMLDASGVKKNNIPSDLCLCFQTDQGKGKGIFTKYLANKNDFYYSCEDVTDIKDLYRSVRGKFIVEVNEGILVNRKESGVVKALMSKTEISYIDKFKTFETIRRSGVSYILTVNDFSFLKDETGNRRYGVIRLKTTKDGEFNFRYLSGALPKQEDYDFLNSLLSSALNEVLSIIEKNDMINLNQEALSFFKQESNEAIQTEISTDYKVTNCINKIEASKYLSDKKDIQINKDDILSELSKDEHFTGLKDLKRTIKVVFLRLGYKESVFWDSDRNKSTRGWIINRENVQIKERNTKNWNLKSS